MPLFKKIISIIADLLDMSSFWKIFSKNQLWVVTIMQAVWRYSKRNFNFRDKSW